MSSDFLFLRPQKPAEGGASDIFFTTWRSISRKNATFAQALERCPDLLNRQIQYGGHEANAHFLSLTAVRRLFAVAPIRIQAWDECFFPFRMGVWRYLQVGERKHVGLTLFSYAEEAGAAKWHENDWQNENEEKISMKWALVWKMAIFATS